MGPKGETGDPYFERGRHAAHETIRAGAEPIPGPFVPLEAPEDARLSIAEAAVLRLALAAGATEEDVQVSESEPSDSEAATDVLPAWSDTTIEPAYRPPSASTPDAAHPPTLGQASTEDFVDTPPTEPDAPARALDVAPLAFEPAETTIADAPAVIGRPTGVVSGTQVSVPGESTAAKPNEKRSPEEGQASPTPAAADKRAASAEPEKRTAPSAAPDDTKSTPAAPADPEAQD